MSESETCVFILNMVECKNWRLSKSCLNTCVLFGASSMYDVKGVSDLNSYNLHLVTIHLKSVPGSQLQPILVPCDLRFGNTMGLARQGDRGADLGCDQV